MDANGWTNFWLLLIFVMLLFLNGKIKRLSHSIDSTSSSSGEDSRPTGESMHQIIGKRVEMKFSTGSKDTVRVLDVDDYCVLAECVYASLGMPAGTQWVLPLKDIVSIKVLP